MKFYTNVTRHRNKILVRGIKDGVPYSESHHYKPYLFIPAGVQTKYRTLRGDHVGKIDFESMSAARQWINENEDVSGRKIYGLTDWVYQFIYEHFSGTINYDPAQISVVYIDIEVSIEDGFPDIQAASNEVTAITLSRNGQKTVLACGDYETDRKDVKYYRCSSEREMLKAFLEIWNSVQYSPDVVTGWNIEFFDIPYLVNRIRKVLGESEAHRLSPWGVLDEYTVELRGRENVAFKPLGVAVLDYINLYKKFTYTEQESYKLDHIANVELGVKKLDYSEYGNLTDLYRNNFQKYIDYNIRDVELIEMLEDKMKLIELVFTMSYDAKINFVDTLGSTKQWDIIIHNYLMDRCVVIPHVTKKSDSVDFAGGYVKNPKVGMSKWIVSFDLNSLYPHLIMQYNIGPETFITRLDESMSIDEILGGKVSKYHDYLDRGNYSITANLCMYSREKQGFLAALMQKMYEDRSTYKKQMLEVKKEYEKTKDPILEKEVARLNNLQMARKIQLNSAYGALGNRWFRWFDVNHAEAITLSGQLSIRWIENKINDYMNRILKTTGKDYVVASDTDSIYITLEDLVTGVLGNETDDVKVVKFIDKVCRQKFEPFIDESYAELATYMRAYDQKMHMKRENIANKGIWKAKKMYILNVWNSEGIQYDKPKLKMMGIEAVRSSTPSSCRDNIKKALEIIMNKPETSLHQFIADYRSEFNGLEFDMVSFPRGVNDIEKYSNMSTLYEKGTPIQVKGAIFFNHLLNKLKLENKYERISSGEKIKFCYLKTPNPYGFSVISCSNGYMPPEFNLKPYIDYDKQFEKAFIDPINSIISTIGWSTEKRSTLDSFFE